MGMLSGEAALVALLHSEVVRSAEALIHRNRDIDVTQLLGLPFHWRGLLAQVITVPALPLHLVE